jgi:gamma-glutamyltranspeptidase
MYPTPRSHRPLIMGRNGAIGSNHPMATQAGLDTLRAGGNAVDAAVATSLALGVCEPMMSGLGGDGFFHVFMAQGDVARVYNGTGPAPQNATPERYHDGIAITGPLSASVPGKLAGLAAMHAAHGRLPWARLALPAIALARDGFAATHGYGVFTETNRARLAADPRSAKVFLNKALADLVIQPDLARTLEEIAADGAETFYRGRLATRLAAGFAEAGMLITAADLAACTAEVTAPIGITYRGWDIRQTPPNSTGFTLLQMLKTVERFDLHALTPSERVHVLVEAKKLAFLDRESYGADPRFETVPLDMLLSDAYADAQAARIDVARAASVPLHAEAAEGDTTYFCVIDAEGNAVSGIQSINSAYGSGVTAGDTGVLMNNRMAYWHLAPGHANRLVPGKRVRHTMNAPMVFRDGKLWGVLGTPGADNQVQVNLQVLTAMLDFGADPQTALEMPRWTSSQTGQGANWPHDGDGALTIETDFDAGLLADLERRGHHLTRVGHLGGPCSMQAIRLMPNGVRVAGSDPRRDGWAGAY